MTEVIRSLPNPLKIACGAQAIGVIFAGALLLLSDAIKTNAQWGELGASAIILTLLIASALRRSVAIRRICVALVGTRAGLIGLTIVWEIASNPMMAYFSIVPFLMAVLTIWALDTAESRDYFAV